jgi:hypothetical protein
VTAVKGSVERFLFWTPRILCLVFAVFISLFALDVFGEGYGFWNTILAFLIHLIPTGIILVVLAISWRWEWVGGILFIALGAAYIVSTWNKVHWSAHLVLSGSLFLIGVLFLINRWYKAGLRP